MNLGSTPIISSHDTLIILSISFDTWVKIFLSISLNSLIIPKFFLSLDPRREFNNNTDKADSNPIKILPNKGGISNDTIVVGLGIEKINSWNVICSVDIISTLIWMPNTETK